MSELALRLIAENKAAHDRGEDATSLDLGRCGLTRIPEELFDCVWLEKLMISNIYWDWHLSKWIESNNSGTKNSIIAIPSNIAALQSLKILQIGGEYDNIWEISEVNFLENLTQLQALNLSFNQISEVHFLENLTQLKSLYLSLNRISEVNFLKNLTQLQSLNLSFNQISEVNFLENLTQLQSLDLRDNQISEFHFLKNLTQLKSLYLSYNEISEVNFLENLTQLQSLDLSNNEISEVNFLENLTQLQFLDLRENQIREVHFLKNLIQLQSLDLRENKIRDVHFLKNLTQLQSLYLRGNKIRDVHFLENLTQLKSLYLSKNKIRDVHFLENLTQLKSLDLSNNEIREVPFLENLPQLQYLDLSNNEIREVHFSENLPQLQSLDLSNNQIREVHFLGNLPQLQSLDLKRNQIREVHFLENLPQLQSLNLSYNQISVFGKTFLENCPLLYTLNLSENPIKNIPNEVFNRHNVLDDVKSYFRDLEKGKIKNNEVKVILIGNGSVGKTQIAKRLVFKEKFVFDEPHYSTHGITLLQQTLPSELFSAGILLNLWDFAGQEIYHATHRLFMQTKALFVLVWDIENEKNPYHVYNGKQYLNEKLTYWLEYARCFSQNSPILVLQNKVDNLEERGRKLPTEVEKQYQTDFSIAGFVQVSAKTGRGFKILEEKICQVFEQNEGFKTELLKDLPLPWAAVRDKVRAEQGLKKISIETFRDWCAEQEVGDSLTIILHFLHDTGVLYYQAGYFNNSIILDQSWAISAIYALLDRDGDYYELLEEKQGKLTYKELCKVWRTNTDAERDLFIDFMLSCELCFEITENKDYDTPLTQRTFVVPAMLRESIPEEVLYLEDKYKIRQYEAIAYQFLPKVFMQRFIIKGQRLAEVKHIWQHGILLQYHHVYALVEANYEERTITIKTTTGAEKLIKAIKQELESIVEEGKVKARLRDTGFDALEETEKYWGFLGLIKKDIPNKVIPLPLQKAPVILLTFADNGLPEVKTEADEIYSIVNKNPLVEVQKIESITVKTMAEAMFSYGSQLLMFHFGGHSKQSHIHLQGAQRLDKIDLARTLEPFNKPTLQLVFLNSCQSYGHVNTIASKGVKAIIATNEKINDVQAALFANYFYRCFFEKESTLKKAFEKAETWAIRNADSLIARGLGSTGEIFTKKPKISDSLQLFNLGELNENEPLSSPWTLFIHTKHAEVLNWTLQDFVNEFNKL